eukprot:907699-Alexandrium_andersonii.AAC.1
MTGVCLVQEPLRCPADNAAQQLHLLQVSPATPQAPLDFAHELLIHALFHHIEVWIASGKCEVVSVHDAPRIQFSVVETACAGLAS